MGQDSIASLLKRHSLLCRNQQALSKQVAEQGSQYSAGMLPEPFKGAASVQQFWLILLSQFSGCLICCSPEESKEKMKIAESKLELLVFDCEILWCEGADKKVSVLDRKEQGSCQWVYH